MTIRYGTDIAFGRTGWATSVVRGCQLGIDMPILLFIGTHRQSRRTSTIRGIVRCGDVSVLHIWNQTQRDSQGINLALTRGSRLQVGFFNLRNLPDGIP